MFSLRMLMGVVAISAVYIAGLVYRTDWWQASILTLTYVIYAAAISAALLAKQHRTFFVVFAVFGLAYGWCLYSRFEMLPHRIIRGLAIRLPLVQEAVEAVEEQFGADPFGGASPDGPVFQRIPPGYLEFLSIGNSFAALLISLLAGVIAAAVVRRKQRAVS